jgi:hypothetical protein
VKKSKSWTLQVASGEATRGSEPSIRGGQVAEIQGSRELGGSRGRSPKVGRSKSRVAKLREDQSRPSEEDRWQRSRDLVSSEVRGVEVQKLDAPSREWRSHERIRAVHPRRTGGRDPGIS